jgi:hypothetical protein
MGDYRSAFEERGGTYAFSAIDDLCGEDEGSWGKLLAQRAYCGEGEDCADAERFEGSDVRTRWNCGRRDGVPWSVSGKESDEGSRREGGDCYWGTREAPWLKNRIVRITKKDR